MSLGRAVPTHDAERRARVITVIINPIAGSGRSKTARRRAEVAAAALRLIREQSRVVMTERRGHARELAAAAVTAGDRLVLAWGGDGTVNEVASALIRTATALGIVPAG